MTTSNTLTAPNVKATGVTFDTPELAAAARRLRLAAAEAGLPRGMEIGFRVRDSIKLDGYFVLSNSNLPGFQCDVGDTFDECAADFIKRLPPVGAALAEQKRREAAKLIAEAEEIEDEVNTKAVMAGSEEGAA